MIDAKPTVYNIANGKETSLLQMIKFYEKISGRKLKIVKRKGRSGDITRSVADISKLKSIGFEPQTSLPEGLKKYWDYYSNL